MKPNSACFRATTIFDGIDTHVNMSIRFHVAIFWLAQTLVIFQLCSGSTIGERNAVFAIGGGKIWFKH